MDHKRQRSPKISLSVTINIPLSEEESNQTLCIPQCALGRCCPVLAYLDVSGSELITDKGASRCVTISCTELQSG